MTTHSIHHVSSMTADIAENRRYYTEVLGLRLVKKSVNQDDTRVYHLFYADAVGSPGTDMTFFDFPGMGPNTPGYSQVGATAFLAPQGSLDWWSERLTENGSMPERGVDEIGHDRLVFSDPEGLILELIEDKNLPFVSKPWSKHVPEEYALRGIVGVDLLSPRPEHTARVLTEVLGYKAVGQDIYETQDDSHYTRLRMPSTPPPRPARLGSGGTHHVAFRIKDVDEMNRLDDQVRSMGLSTSGFVDRYYFKSLYFREPGGILFELATDGPGFGSDEPMDSLGEKLALPPFLEPQRTEIEAGLKPI